MYTLSVCHLSIITKAKSKGLFLILPQIHPPGSDLSIISLSRTLSKQDPNEIKCWRFVLTEYKSEQASLAAHWDSGNCDAFAAFPARHSMGGERNPVILDATFLASLQK